MDLLGQINAGHAEGGSIRDIAWMPQYNTGLPEHEAAYALEMATRSLEIDLVKAQGKSMQAMLMQRWDELQSMDESLRALQVSVWMQEDANDAQEEYNDYVEAYTRNIEERKAREAKATQEAVEQIADAIKRTMETAKFAQEVLTQREAFEVRLLEAQGKTEEAEALRRRIARENEIRSLIQTDDDYTAALMMQVFAAEDAKYAEDALAKSRGDAASALEAALAKIQKADFATSYDYRKAIGLTKIRGYDSGGYHPGGPLIVGESGPELMWSGPSRILSNAESQNLLGGGELVAEVRALREDLVQLGIQTAVNTGKSAKLLDRWEGEGLPDNRTELTTWGN
jgi:hypothetical protein